MSIALKNSTAAKIGAVAIGLALAFSLVGAAPAHAQTVEELTAQINDLLATIQSLQAQLAGLSGGGGVASAACPFTWTQTLNIGSTGNDVLKLQQFLNSDPDTVLGSSGAGSPGNETSFYGSITAAGVAKFQTKYAAQILDPLGLPTSGTPYPFGPATRAHANSLCTSAPTTGGDTGDGGTTVTPGTGLTVGSTAQPANSIAPDLAARIPFTKFTLTAGSDGPVTVDNVTIERRGFADNNVFSGIVLLDQNDNLIGDSKTLNSNNQAKVGTSFTIPAGQTRTFTIAGNRANTSTKDGQIAQLAVIGINTSATVSGSLPILGASHTVNESLSIGTAQMSVGPTDQDSDQTEQVGETDIIFAGIRVENTSSEEDIRVRSMRFNQTGSVGSSDLANLTITVDGVEYPLTIDENDTEFFNANFGGGIVIAEGFNKEFVLTGDIVGGANRTVVFDIEEDTDVYIVGETFGFGVTPTQIENGTVGAAGAQFTATAPFYDGSTFTVDPGTLTSFSKSNDVPAQNIAINVPNQPLGGFNTDILGEGITVENMDFHFLFTGSVAGTALTNITLVDENGTIVAGPADGVAVATDAGKVTFSDTVTFPIGKHVYTLRGKLSTAFANDDTIQASTSPTADWTSIKGEDTGKTITLSNTVVSGNVMTVKAAKVDALVSTDPTAQSIVAGVSQFTVSNIQFDGTQSGEDVRFTSAQFRYTQTSGTGDPTNCFAFDGTTQLNNNAVNPLTTGAQTFTFNNNVIVPKGTVKTVAIKCDIPGSTASGSVFNFGVNTADTIQGTGVDSSTTVTADNATALGPDMTVTGAGSLTVTLDPSSPSYAVAAAGTSDVTLGVFKFSGTNEEQRIDRIALQLTGPAASSTPDGIGTVTVYDGSTAVGTALFTGASRFATSTLTQTVLIPKDDDKVLTVKGTLSDIGASQPGTQGGLLKVDVDGDDSTGTRSIGQASGSNINNGGSDTAVAGVRTFKSAPSFAKITIPSTNLVASDNVFYRFSVTADSADDLGIYKFTFQMATSGSAVTIADVNVFAYTDAGFSIPVSGVARADGALLLADLTVSNSLDNQVVIENSAGSADPLQIPEGATRFFEIRGTAASVDTNDSVSTTVRGDAAYPSLATLMANAAGIDADTNDDFIWSPNATTTSSINHADWTNGFGLIGLPAINMTSSVVESD